MRKTEASVFYGKQEVGVVFETAPGQIAFRYHVDWLKKSGSFAISHSLPLKSTSYREVAHHYFANFLPEADIRTAIAGRLGLSPENDFDLLIALGGDCAGALTIGEAAAKSENSTTPLDKKKLRKAFEQNDTLFSTLQDVEAHDVRLSLAGAQDKLPVRVGRGDALLMPHGTSASTHILKFPSHRFKHLAENETLMSEFARRMGLIVPTTRLIDLNGLRACLVERYDRSVVGENVTRLHQEDFCQALGRSHKVKYEKSGGPGFRDIYSGVEEISTDVTVDLERTLRWLVFNVIIGNCDAHAKNISLLMVKPGAWVLTPHYDLVCTKMYPVISKDLAMSIGGTNDSGTVTGTHWMKLAKDLKVGPGFLRSLVSEMAGRANDVFTDSRKAFESDYGRNDATQLIEKAVHEQARRLTSQLLK